MPLPDSSDPDNANIYDQLSSKKLGSIDKASFDIVQDPIFLNAEAEDELRRVNLVGQATNMQSQSGPIPGTSKIHDLYASDSDNPFTPGEGEVWLLAGGTVKSVSSSAGRAFVLLDDGTINDMELSDESWSSGQQNPWDPISGTGPFYLDSNTTIKVSISFSSGSSARIYAYLIRVR